MTQTRPTGPPKMTVTAEAAARDFETFLEHAAPPCQAVVRHPGAPGSTVEGGDRRQVS